jgi:hypothetical protein
MPTGFLFIIVYFININTFFLLNLNTQQPQVRGTPWVSHNTAKMTGRYVPVPATGAVYAGRGILCSKNFVMISDENLRHQTRQYL